MTSNNNAAQISPLALFGDRVLLVAIVGSGIASLVLGMQFVDFGLSIGATIALLLLARVGYASLSGAGPNLFSLTVANHAVEISLLTNFHAGTLKPSPRLNTAQHIRAFLAAIATTALP